MERSISATEANRDFSKLLSEVEGGATVAVTKRGKVVARIVPTRDSEEAERLRRAAAMRALLDEMAAQPLLHLGKITRDDGYD